MDIQILQLVEGARQAKGLTVIIDVFRAFTTESFIMNRNPNKIIPVGDVEVAWDYKTKHPEAILCGERGGAIIEGFDFGNSLHALLCVAQKPHSEAYLQHGGGRNACAFRYLRSE